MSTKILFGRLYGLQFVRLCTGATKQKHLTLTRVFKAVCKEHEQVFLQNVWQPICLDLVEGGEEQKQWPLTSSCLYISLQQMAKEMGERDGEKGEG